MERGEPLLFFFDSQVVSWGCLFILVCLLNFVLGFLLDLCVDFECFLLSASVRRNNVAWHPSYWGRLRNYVTIVALVLRALIRGKASDVCNASIKRICSPLWDSHYLFPSNVGCTFLFSHPLLLQFETLYHLESAHSMSLQLFVNFVSFFLCSCFAGSLWL